MCIVGEDIMLPLGQPTSEAFPVAIWTKEREESISVFVLFLCTKSGVNSFLSQKHLSINFKHFCTCILQLDYLHWTFLALIYFENNNIFL